MHESLAAQILRIPARLWRAAELVADDDGLETDLIAASSALASVSLRTSVATLSHGEM